MRQIEVNLHLASTEIKQDCENQVLNFRLSSNECLMPEFFFNGRKNAYISHIHCIPARAVKVWEKVLYKHFSP